MSWHSRVRIDLSEAMISVQVGARQAGHQRLLTTTSHLRSSPCAGSEPHGNSRGDGEAQRVGGTSECRFKIAKDADWRNFADVRSSWKNSDVVGPYVVFDISHNKCRLIATINYKWRMVYIRWILSPVEYDRKGWEES
jgi:mRNA interferase HigB